MIKQIRVIMYFHVLNVYSIYFLFSQLDSLFINLIFDRFNNLYWMHTAA